MAGVALKPGAFLAACAVSLLVGTALVAGHLKIAYGLALIPVALVTLARPGVGLFAALGVAVAVPQHQVSRAWLLVGFFAAAGVLAKRHRSGMARADIAFVGFAAWTTLSWLLHLNPLLGVRFFVATAVVPLGLYAAARLMVSRDLLLPTLWTLLGSGTVAAVTVLIEWAHGSVLFSDPARYQWEGGGGEIYRPGGVLGGSPAAAIGLSMILLATLALVRVRRRLVLACDGVMLLAIIATYSRAGWVALAAGLLVVGYLLPYRHWGAVVYALALVAVAALVFRGHISNAQAYRQGVIRPGSTSGRLDFLHQSWPMATDTPRHFLVGRGYYAYLRNPTPDANMLAHPVIVERGGPHNEYVRALLEQGVIGLILLVAWLGYAMRAGVRAVRRGEGDDRLMLVGLLGAAVAFVAAGFFHDLAHNSPDLSIACVILGLLVTAVEALQRYP
jgi:O-antigen ligase